MAKKKVHLAGADPWAGKSTSASIWRYLGCSNPDSEKAASVHKDSDMITTDPSKVTCCHCRVKMAAEAVRLQGPKPAPKNPIHDESAIGA